MYKRINIKILTVIMAFSLFSALVVNAAATSAAPNASNYLSIYSANVVSNSSGIISVYFDVNATRVMDQVGASNIVVQVYSNGVWAGVASYYGSTSNGMLAPNTYSHTGSVIHQGLAGNQYRALVTVYAGNSSGSDSRTVTTNTVYAY